MRKLSILLGSVAVMAVLGGAAEAADLGPAPEEVVDWSGLYAGIHAGYGWADADAKFNSDFVDNVCFEKVGFPVFWGCSENLSPEGAFGGAQAGYNLVFGPGIMLGVEGDYSIANLRDDGRNGDTDFANLGFLDFSTEVTQKVEDLASVRGRLGLAFDRFLPFVTGGWGWAKGKRTAQGFFVNDTDENWHDGWVVGGGIEYMIAHDISVKAEYRYYDLSKEDYLDNSFTEGTKVDLDIQTVELGLNVHLW
jgi:outer membrane immunogenic protein